MVALRYFADIDPVPDAFRQALERRTRQHGGRLEGGARVASYLLAQWDLYVKGWTHAQALHDSAWRPGADELDHDYQLDDEDAYREISEELADLSNSFARSESSGWFYSDSDEN